ncbi:LysR substrate-binding domain-containing protein (plasmid) [Enterobacter mori]|uniref:LysR family transcriptional regulator n=1 Tax=Enterobacter mori TaxID=539813 RepID=UPI001EDB336C|nr:LysR family transcriptional regulator [Enterobacter mori]UKJ23753.1 LysR substrate-binding domain-containing protein [Enterobacter mori]
MDRLKSMAVYVKVADAGSFAAAAELLNLSPQMVAKHIVSLEERLGATLINRTTRRQNLTAVGEAYYSRCRLILAEVETADMLAHSLQNIPRGILRVNAPPLFGAYNLSPHIPDFLLHYPDVILELTLNDRLVNPVEEGYEVLIRIGDPKDDSLIARPLMPFQLIACATPSYLKHRGIPSDPAELIQHDCLPVLTGTPSASHIWQFNRNGVTESVSVKGRLSSNEWVTLLNAALSDAGIILGPSSVLTQEIEKGHLVRVLEEYEGPSRPVNILYPANRGPSAKVQSFVNFVAERLSTSY